MFPYIVSEAQESLCNTALCAIRPGRHRYLAGLGLLAASSVVHRWFCGGLNAKQWRAVVSGRAAISVLERRRLCSSLGPVRKVTTREQPWLLMNQKAGLKIKPDCHSFIYSLSKWRNHLLALEQLFVARTGLVLRLSSQNTWSAGSTASATCPAGAQQVAVPGL